jgi:hypothetical protein
MALRAEYDIIREKVSGFQRAALGEITVSRLLRNAIAITATGSRGKWWLVNQERFERKLTYRIAPPKSG